MIRIARLSALTAGALVLAGLPWGSAEQASAAELSESAVTADCVITPHADWVPAEVHVRCATTGPFKALALCSSGSQRNVQFASPWTRAGSTAQVECPLWWTLTGWGKQGGGSA